ncbi:hypothetical protein HHK36_017968 [Tetracentron sinense]|uniref:Glutaredoxin domain-containing protein n=1 Tax=Tetracentron sinense TaxID=13715 RepID=A0A834Z319_TETSI|nr:hypothetical protein HHK36_017968 [Tetracentron sinense]
MKGMNGRILKKLKSIPLITSLKPGRFLQVNSTDGVSDPLPSNSNWVLQNQLSCKEQDQKINHSNFPVLEPGIIDTSELIRDLGDAEMEFAGDVGNKENIGPMKKPKDPVLPKDNSENSSISETRSDNLRIVPSSELDVSSSRRHELPVLEDVQSSESATHNLRHTPLSEIDVSSFRRPDLNSGTLFDPNLLAAFEQAVMIHIRAHEAERIERSEEPPSEAHHMEDNPLLDFEEKCPPGGSESVILYTTSLRGIRKTFEDCHSIRFLLGSFRILFVERDVSMHLDFREELWRILGGRVVPPVLFIKGRYIGRADEVVTLHEQGKLRPLLQGVPLDPSNARCQGCGGIRFVVCFKCRGSCKVFPEEGNDGLSIRCSQCNENGLILCPICC